jgi:hypothetical protein
MAEGAPAAPYLCPQKKPHPDSRRKDREILERYHPCRVPRSSKNLIYDRTRTNGPEIIPHMKFGKYVRFAPESQAFQEWIEHHGIGSAFSKQQRQE